ncbi:MAG: hypothetical protein Q9190_007580 [Brigantiaea leucoxantha]
MAPGADYATEELFASVSVRNFAVRNDPARLGEVIQELIAQKCLKEGRGFITQECIVTWKPSRLPFHVEVRFSFYCANFKACRLLCIKDRGSERVDEYARRTLVDLRRIMVEKAVRDVLHPSR